MVVKLQQLAFRFPSTWSDWVSLRGIQFRLLWTQSVNKRNWRTLSKKPASWRPKCCGSSNLARCLLPWSSLQINGRWLITWTSFWFGWSTSCWLSTWNHILMRTQLSKSTCLLSTKKSWLIHLGTFNLSVPFLSCWLIIPSIKQIWNLKEPNKTLTSMSMCLGTEKTTVQLVTAKKRQTFPLSW